MKTDRRRFLRLSAAFAAAGALPRRPLAATSTTNAGSTIYDAIVVGGGLSGLMAARTLVGRGHGKILVLEGRDRVGGRTLNQPVAAGGIAEAGGQWIGPTQTAITGLMDELGIGSFPTYSAGDSVDDTDGAFGLNALLDYLGAQARLDALSQTVPLDRPWDAPNAAALDATTVRQWMNANMSTPGGKALLELEVQSTLGGNPQDVSLLYFLFYVHSGTDLEHLSEHAQSRRIVGGSQAVSLALAAELGSIVRLGLPVDSIRYGDRGALVACGKSVFAARRVIVAMMPKDVARITFLPSLPSTRVKLQAGWVGAPGAKFHAVYPTAFWRANGQNGQALSDSQFIALAWDNSPPSGTPGILVGFPLDELHMPLEREVRRSLVLSSFAHFFGPQAHAAIDYAEFLWQAEPLTGGCVSPLPPGLLTTYGPALREPVGPIHWAGTETSEIWCGYMDGAVRAGERAASEVAESLSWMRARPRSLR